MSPVYRIWSSRQRFERYKHFKMCTHRHTGQQLSYKISTRGCVLRQIKHESKMNAVFVLRHVPKCFFHTDKLGGALLDILYFLKIKFH